MATSKTRTKKTKPSATDMMAALTTPKPKAAKSKMPLVVISNEAEVKEMMAIVTAKTAEKAAKSKSEAAQDKFRGSATGYFESQCQADNHLHSSVKFTADVKGTPHFLTFTQRKICKSMLEAETTDDLHSCFGDEFDSHFTPERTIQIDTSVLGDGQITAVLLGIQKALKFADDPAIFQSAISVVAKIEPKESFYRDRILNPDFRKLANVAVQDGLAVPYDPSFKL